MLAYEDQSTQEELNSADLLMFKSTNITYKATTNGILPVELSHALAKVNFVLTLGDAFYDVLIGLVYNPVKDFTIHGPNVLYKFFPLSGDITVDDASHGNIFPFEGTYTPSTPQAKTATANYEAIIVPQTFAKGELKVTFSIGKGTYEWTNDSEITLESGKTYNLPISVTSAPPVETHNGRVYVDMGLSVKWATCNVGATSPFESGDFFAWGETEPYYESLDPLTWRTNKMFGYDWDSYSWIILEGGRYFNRYCPSDKREYWDQTASCDIPDDKTDFKDYDYEDDAARVNFGGNWRTPTMDEWLELLDNSNCTCVWKSITDGYANPGYLVTSKINDNSIFLPASGYYYDKDLKKDGEIGAYWSSSIEKLSPLSALALVFSSDKYYKDFPLRYYGLPVRPVCP